MIDLDASYLEEVKKILRERVPSCEVLAFGSRVEGTAVKYSDLDLAIHADKPLDPQILEDLKDAFSESNLPFIVDIMDWRSISDSFQKVVLQNSEIIQEANVNNPHREPIKEEPENHPIH
ncbi:MAG: nucleotidyltransferase domain-containing protein [Candidatus Omnitrophota bacterium]